MVVMNASAVTVEPTLKSDSFQFQPLAGLLSIKKEEISNLDLFNAIPCLEERINSSPKGSVTRLALLFYLLNKLQEAGLKFYVKGGIIQQYYLGEHARPTYDLDIIVEDDIDTVSKKMERIISTLDAFNIVKYRKLPADDTYYYDAFNCELVVTLPKRDEVRISLDGISNPSIYRRIKPITYQGPAFIKDDFSFKGVPIEYSIADKIVAVTSELTRSYKHLVDLYSLIHVDINFSGLKEYLTMVMDNDNKVRKQLGKEIGEYVFQIKDDKDFVGNYIFTVLQAGYNIPFNEMKNEINNWLKLNIVNM